MEKKFGNACIGDKVWDIRYGWGTITKIDDISNGDYVLNVKFEDDCWEDTSYTLDGFFFKTYKHPLLFWNEVKLPTNEEDKKPSNLAKYLKDKFDSQELEQAFKELFRGGCDE